MGAEDTSGPAAAPAPPTDSRHLARLLEAAAERAGPDHEALCFEGRTYTSGELRDRSARISGGLRELGVGPGDRVMVVMATTPDVGVVYNAIWRAGAAATPAIFLLPPQELRHILTDSGAEVVVTTADLLDPVRTATEGLDVTVVCPGGPEDTVDLDELAAADPGPIVDRDATDLAALMYTGGTTGRAKGVMLTHDNLWNAGRVSYAASVEEEKLAGTIVPLPLSHSFGLLVSVTGAFDPDPSTNVLMRWFDPGGFLDLVEAHRPEQATMVPTMLRVLLDEPLEDRDLSSLRRIVSGSAPLPTEVLEAIERRIPSATVVQGYGLTESSAVATVDRPSRRVVGSVGLPMPEVEVRVVDEDGTPLPDGEHGEVRIRSATVSPGYWDAPDATASTFVDGWLRTGDVGSLSEDGHLTIHDRLKDLILRSGFNIYPADVEDALAEHPDVAAAGVVGRDDDVHGEEVVAFVVPADGATLVPDEVVAWARERIGPKSYPREVHVVDDLPLTPVLKLDRKALRDRV